jgi:hypothetical protein
VFISNTAHEEEQPVHLQLLDSSKAIAINFKEYASPEQRYCPAGVYEIVDRSQRAAAADQRLELPALQDLRHQGSDAEHPLGGTRGRRRAELSQHVSELATCRRGRAWSRFGQAGASILRQRPPAGWSLAACCASAQSTCSRTSSDGSCSRESSAAMIAGEAGGVAERDGDVAQPARVPDPADRAAGQPVLEFVFAPREQLGQRHGVEAVAHRKIRGRRGAQSGSRDSTTGSRRTRRCGCRSAAAARPEWRPCNSIVR